MGETRRDINAMIAAKARETIKIPIFSSLVRDSDAVPIGYINLNQREIDMYTDDLIEFNLSFTKDGDKSVPIDFSLVPRYGGRVWIKN